MPFQIWLEVGNVSEEVGAKVGEKTVRLQLKGDKGEPKPEWWPVESALLNRQPDLAQRIFDANDKKRIVLACLKYTDKGLQCGIVRILDHFDVTAR